MTIDLFDAVAAIGPSREAMADGAVLLRGFAGRFEGDLLPALRAIVAQAPFRHMSTPGGHQMSVAMTNCGDAGWVTDRTGYRYDGVDPNSGEKWPEQGLPALLVVGPEETSDVEESGQGMYRAIWPVEVGLVIAAKTGPAARKYARIYGAAIRGALLQGRSLGIEGLTVQWRGEGTGTIGVDKQRRTMASNANLFAVTVDNVVSWRRGPSSDKPPIPTDWPEVTETEIETEIEA